jgi:hypothetical protein
MTPKEKAKELYQKYFSMITIERPIDKNAAIPYVKQCALIAVDEVLGFLSYESHIKYWQEVKQEIEAL